MPITAVGETRNPYREWIGALIRADVYGWALPDQPAAAARLVFSDASLSHRNNGIYAAMWAAALVSAACVAGTVAEAIERSLDYVPARSRLAEALGFVYELYRTSHTWEQALEQHPRPFRPLQLGALDQQRLPDHRGSALGRR